MGVRGLAESGMDTAWVRRPASAFTQICLGGWRNFNREKKRIMARAPAPVSGDAGLLPGGAHQPISACLGLGASCDPFVSETTVGQRKASGAVPAVLLWAVFLGYLLLVTGFCIVSAHARA